MRKRKVLDRIKLFLAIDGGEQGTITRGGVGSKRYRVTFKARRAQLWRCRAGQPGIRHGCDHRAVLRRSGAIVAKDDVQRRRRGGTSVNSDPAEVSMDVDIRSESVRRAAKVDATFLSIVKSAVADENRARSTREGESRPTRV